MTTLHTPLATAELLPGEDEPRVIRLTGELDSTTAGLFASTCDLMTGLPPCDVVVDLEGVTFFDSSALSVLASLHGAVTARQREVILYRPSSTLHSVLAITRMDAHFTIVDEPVLTAAGGAAD